MSTKRNPSIDHAKKQAHKKKNVPNRHLNREQLFNKIFDAYNAIKHTNAHKVIESGTEEVKLRRLWKAGFGEKPPEPEIGNKYLSEKKINKTKDENENPAEKKISEMAYEELLDKIIDASKSLNTMEMEGEHIPTRITLDRLLMLKHRVIENKENIPAQQQKHLIDRIKTSRYKVSAGLQ